MKRHHSCSCPLLRAFLFFFFVSWSSSSSLYQEVGLKATDTGIIFAVLSVSALCAQVCYGFIQDSLGLKKNLLWYMTVQLILSGPAYLLNINILLGSIFGGLFVGLTFNGGIGVLESYTERVARQSTFDFGRARMWGLWAGPSPFSLPFCCLTSIPSLIFSWRPAPGWSSFSC